MCPPERMSAVKLLVISAIWSAPEIASITSSYDRGEPWNAASVLPSPRSTVDVGSRLAIQVRSWSVSWVYVHAVMVLKRGELEEQGG